MNRVLCSLRPLNSLQIHSETSKLLLQQSLVFINTHLKHSQIQIDIEGNTVYRLIMSDSNGHNTSFSRIREISPKVRSRAETLLFANKPLSCIWRCLKRSFANRCNLHETENEEQLKQQKKSPNHGKFHLCNDTPVNTFQQNNENRCKNIIYTKQQLKHATQQAGTVSFECL